LRHERHGHWRPGIRRSLHREALAEADTDTVSYNRDFSEHQHARVTAVQGELFDIPKLVRTINEHGVTSIIHTAGMSHPEISIDLACP